MSEPIGAPASSPLFNETDLQKKINESVLRPEKIIQEASPKEFNWERTFECSLRSFHGDSWPKITQFISYPIALLLTLFTSLFYLSKRKISKEEYTEQLAQAKSYIEIQLPPEEKTALKMQLWNKKINHYQQSFSSEKIKVGEREAEAVSSDLKKGFLLKDEIVEKLIALDLEFANFKNKIKSLEKKKLNISEHYNELKKYLQPILNLTPYHLEKEELFTQKTEEFISNCWEIYSHEESDIPNFENTFKDFSTFIINKIQEDPRSFNDEISEKNFKKIETVFKEAIPFLKTQAKPSKIANELIKTSENAFTEILIEELQKNINLPLLNHAIESEIRKATLDLSSKDDFKRQLNRFENQIYEYLIFNRAKINNNINQIAIIKKISSQKSIMETKGDYLLTFKKIDHDIRNQLESLKEKKEFKEFREELISTLDHFKRELINAPESEIQRRRYKDFQKNLEKVFENPKYKSLHLSIEDFLPAEPMPTNVFEYYKIKLDNLTDDLQSEWSILQANERNKELENELLEIIEDFKKEHISIQTTDLADAVYSQCIDKLINVCKKGDLEHFSKNLDNVKNLYSELLAEKTIDQLIIEILDGFTPQEA